MCLHLAAIVSAVSEPESGYRSAEHRAAALHWVHHSLLCHHKVKEFPRPRQILTGFYQLSVSGSGLSAPVSAYFSDLNTRWQTFSYNISSCCKEVVLTMLTEINC